MTEEKMIEEMAEYIHGNAISHDTRFMEDCRSIARDLYAAVYRKQAEGEWLFEFTIEGDDFYKCSVCGRQEVLSGLCYERTPAMHYPYCHCGAKMKGGEQG